MSSYQRDTNWRVGKRRLCDVTRFAAAKYRVELWSGTPISFFLHYLTQLPDPGYARQIWDESLYKTGVDND